MKKEEIRMFVGHMFSELVYPFVVVCARAGRFILDISPPISASLSIIMAKLYGSDSGAYNPLKTILFISQALTYARALVTWFLFSLILYQVFL
jgi:hypothetical protein